YRPQIEIPIAFDCTPRVPSGLSYACRHPKLFTSSDCPFLAEKLREPPSINRPVSCLTSACQNSRLSTIRLRSAVRGGPSARSVDYDDKIAGGMQPKCRALT